MQATMQDYSYLQSWRFSAHLTPDGFKLLLGRRYIRAKKQGERTDLTSPQSEEKSKTSERLATQHGVSRATVERAGEFATAVEALKAVDPEIETKVASGDEARATR